jgi:hypothetical protein
MEITSVAVAQVNPRIRKKVTQEIPLAVLVRGIFIAGGG